MKQVQTGMLPDLLIIDNDDSFTWNLYQLFASLECGRVEVVRAADKSFDDIVSWNPSHLLLSPGPCGPESALLCIEVVNQLRGKVPILGVCLGHQVIAYAYGKRVSPSGSPLHGKQSNISHSASGIFEGIPSPFTVARYHSLVVESNQDFAPLAVLAVDEKNTIMAIADPNKEVWGVQFHPESFMSEYGSVLARNFLKRRIISS